MGRARPVDGACGGLILIGSVLVVVWRQTVAELESWRTIAPTAGPPAAGAACNE